MSEIDDLISQLPTQRLAEQLGEDPEAVDQAARAALPALLGGLQANAMDPGGEASIRRALQDHDPSLAQGEIDVDRVDTADGQAISSNIFGPQEDEVVSRLGGVGGQVSSGLIKKLIPILAPIVLSYLMGKLQQGGAGGSTPQASQGPGQGAREGGVLPGPDGPRGQGSPADDGGLADILGSILSERQSDPQRSEPRQVPSGGDIIGDILGGLLGGGRR